MKSLTSNAWPKAIESMRKCHVSLVGAAQASVEEWSKAFQLLAVAIQEEKIISPYFAPELSCLTKDTGCDYDFVDIFEEYFDFMEEKEEWDEVIASCDSMIEMFDWEEKYPSEYMYRKGNALMQAGMLAEAEAFGKEWLSEYPDDCYAAASNVFLMLKMNKLEEAEALTEKYLKEELVCDKNTDTLFMAAYRLYELTDNIYAKQRVEKKMAEYNAFV